MQTFELLAADTRGMTLAELATALDAPKTSLLNLLPALVEAGYLEHVAGRYGIGPQMFVLSGTVLHQRKFTVLARPSMTTLVESTGETASVAVLDRATDMAVYVDSVQSKWAINYRVDVGLVRPLYASVAGKLLLAYQPDDYVRGYLERTELIAQAPRTITSKSKLKAELAAIRKNGWAATVEESSEGVAGFAAPIFDRDRTIIAAMSIGGPVQRVVGNQTHCLASLRAAASQVSRMLGFIAAS